MKNTTINIKASDEEKRIVREICKKHGFQTISSMFWYMVNKLKKKKGFTSGIFMSLLLWMMVLILFLFIVRFINNREARPVQIPVLGHVIGGKLDDINIIDTMDTKSIKSLKTQIWTSFIPDNKYREDALLYAIWNADGGNKTKYPFGIRSINCEGYDDCKRICRNTIRNNISRFSNRGKDDKRSYLQFLRDRYAPLSDSPLNRNWLPNILFFLDKYDPLKHTI